MGTYEKEIEESAKILSTATHGSAFCGAGNSEESGIATFRDPGGLWDQVDPVEVGTAEGLISALDRNADKLLPVFMEMLDSFEQADHNPGHKALADLESMGLLTSVITQNVDNLHQEAGSLEVIEVHGNLFRMRCLSCNRIKDVERKPFVSEIKEKLNAMTEFTLTSMASLAPVCDTCSSMMRPDVVMFGEAVQHLPKAFGISQNTDVMLVLGTSGNVYPAAYFPIEAKKAGARVIVINPTENAFSAVTDVYIPLKTGEALPAIVDKIKERAH
ncbi:MAG: NAD-dependent protein deacylase [Deltaproteobacteria bacterium]|nr:NAD-dependent protein deacylase [Deltaproteobacteria bacterium]